MCNEGFHLSLELGQDLGLHQSWVPFHYILSKMSTSFILANTHNTSWYIHFVQYSTYWLRYFAMEANVGGYKSSMAIILANSIRHLGWDKKNNFVSWGNLYNNFIDTPANVTKILISWYLGWNWKPLFIYMENCIYAVFYMIGLYQCCINLHGYRWCCQGSC